MSPFIDQPISARMRWLGAVALLAFTSACSEASTSAKDDAASAKPTSAAATSTAAATGSAAASASAAPGSDVPADWEDVDLAKAGKLWQGYTLKGPKGAKLGRGAEGPELAAGDWGVSLSLTHVKKSTAGLDTAKAYGVKWRALTDTDDLFEYETSGEQDGKPFVRYNFDMFVKVDDKTTVGCSGLNNQKTREANAPMMAACKTLRKRQ